MYIDSHVHYAHKRFDSTRDILLPQLHENGLEVAIEAAISIESNRQLQDVLQVYPWIFYSVGLHSTRVSFPRIAELIGELKGMCAEEIMQVTAENTKELFGLYGRIRR